MVIYKKISMDLAQMLKNEEKNDSRKKKDNFLFLNNQFMCTYESLSIF